MRPAPSVILFSTLSGAGFGLLFYLGLMAVPPVGWVALVFFALAYALSLGGLIAAAFHLKNPKAAWRSYSQWRTSWLSREAWAAAISLTMMGLYAVALMVFHVHVALLGWIGAAISLVTVLTTAMIYAQLRSVPRWNQWATPAMFLAYALAGGALLAGRVRHAAILLLLAGAANAWHWWRGDRRFAEVATTIQSATRLGGAVTAFEPPHTGENYLTREMVFTVARRHVVKLRAIALLLASLVPAAMTTYPMHHGLAAIAVACHLIGVAVSRWLFFAEAEHVVGLYYGAHRGAEARA